jgi:hypothetical protein
MLHSKMKKLITILIMLSLISNSFGQSNFVLRGELTDCSDSLELILGTIQLLQNDSVISTTYSDEYGEFKFKDLKQGSYQIQTDYYFYSNKIIDISIPSDNNVNICLSDTMSDSLLTSGRIRPLYTIYYFGMPKYSDENLNEIGKEYGVKWQNMGCVVDDNFDKYNVMIEKILTFRNGLNWEDKFWLEVQKKYE